MKQLVNIFRRLFGKETNGQEIVAETITTPKESSKDRARRMAHLISGRAKELYNKDTMKWTDCIRIASKELKEDGKL